MLKLAALGGAVWLVGATKFALHLNAAPTLEDYLAFRCGPGAAALETGAATHTWLSAAHCWGCPVMAIGAALVALATSRLFWRTRQRSQVLT